MNLEEIRYLHRLIKKYKTKELFESALSRNDISLKKYRFTYNNIIAFTELGYKIKLKLVNKEAHLIFVNITHCNNYILVNKQDYFQYKFMKKLYLYSIKYKNSKGYNFLQKYFEKSERIVYTNDDYYITEDPVKIPYSKSGYRIDFKFHLEDGDGIQYWLLLEFFESAHLKKTDPSFSIEKNRLNSIRCDNIEVNKEYASIAIYWEKFLDNKKYFNRFIKHIIRTIKSFQNITNKEHWCIKELKKIVGSTKLAQMIYSSSEKENIPCINLKHFDILIFGNDERIRNILHKKFFDNCTERSNYQKITNTNDIDISYSDDSDSINSDSIDTIDDNITYFDKDNDKPSAVSERLIKSITKGDCLDDILLSNYGLHLYISIINANQDLVKNDRCIKFLKQISKALVVAIKKQRDAMLSMNKLNNIAYGLEDIYKYND
jgi:hypothetical protein